MKLVSLVLLVAALAGPDIAQAQDSGSHAAPLRVQITPYVSVGSSAWSGVGASVRWAVAPKNSRLSSCGRAWLGVGDDFRTWFVQSAA